MRTLLKYFWEWLGKSPEEYAKYGLKYVKNGMEFDFPEFEALKGYAYDIVNSNVVLTNEISDLLSVMALDNEGENLLEYIEEHSSNEQLNMIVEVGVSHLQPAARWQIAELICRRKPENYLKYLSVLSEDSHSYVRQRAQNCIEYCLGG